MNQEKENNSVKFKDVFQIFIHKRYLFLLILIISSACILFYLHLMQGKYEFVQYLTPPSREVIYIDGFILRLQTLLIPKFPDNKIEVLHAENKKIKISIITNLINQPSLIKILDETFLTLQVELSKQIEEKNKFIQYNNNIINKLRIYGDKYRENRALLAEYEENSVLKKDMEANLIRINIENINSNLFYQKLFLKKFIDENARSKNIFLKNNQYGKEVNKLISSSANFSVYTPLQIKREVRLSFLQKIIVFLFVPFFSVFIVFLFEALSFKEQ